MLAAMLALSLCISARASRSTNNDTSSESKTESDKSDSQSAIDGEISAAEQSEATISLEAFLKIANSEYLPIFGNLINCDDWNSADEIPVYMYYAWYRDYINSTATPEKRLERYQLDSDKIPLVGLIRLKNLKAI